MCVSSVILLAQSHISNWRSRRERRIEAGVMRSASREMGVEEREFGEQYSSFPLRSSQIFERHSREPTPRQAQGLSVQFSMFNPGTRPNSRVFFVTSITPRLRAGAAMNTSFAPIIVPRVFKWARESSRNAEMQRRENREFRRSPKRHSARTHPAVTGETLRPQTAVPT